MLNAAAFAGRRRAQTPTGNAFSPQSLYASGEDGLFLAPHKYATLRQQIYGDEVVTAADQLVGTALSFSQNLALSDELVADPDLLDNTGWSGAASWVWTSGQYANTLGNQYDKIQYDVITGAPAGNLLYKVNVVYSQLSGGAIQVRLGITSMPPQGTISAPGTYEWDLLAGANDNNIAHFTGAGGADATFTHTSVRAYFGRVAFAAVDADRPAVKTDGTLYWLDRPGTESLKLWLPGGITGATLAYASDAGTTIQTGQTVADGAELLLSSRIYALVLIDRALTTPETDDLTAWLDAARTTGLAGQC